MKSKFITIILSFFGLVGCSSNIEDLKQLGEKPFTKENWQSATQQERAKMVYSFLKEREIRKLSANEVIALLGKPTAYYEYDEFPAYLIGPKTIQTEYGNGYLLAFPINRETGLIKKFVLIPSL